MRAGAHIIFFFLGNRPQNPSKFSFSSAKSFAEEKKTCLGIGVRRKFSLTCQRQTRVGLWSLATVMERGESKCSRTFHTLISCIHLNVCNCRLKHIFHVTSEANKICASLSVLLFHSFSYDYFIKGQNKFISKIRFSLPLCVKLNMVIV